MKLYLISQNKNNGYDTFDSAVVCANSEYEAARIYPNDDDYKYDNKRDLWYHISWNGDIHYREYASDWAKHASDVQVKYLGEADSSVPFGTVCASFNAG